MSFSVFWVLFSGLRGGGGLSVSSPFSSQNEADFSMPLLLSSSPGPNKSCCFQREPPEGCEKVRVWEETRYVCMYTSDHIFTGFFPLKCSEKCQLCQRRSLTRCIPTAHANILLLQSISHLHFHWFIGFTSHRLMMNFIFMPRVCQFLTKFMLFMALMKGVHTPFFTEWISSYFS